MEYRRYEREFSDYIWREIQHGYVPNRKKPHDVVIKDESIKSTLSAKAKADSKNEAHIAATMPDKVIKVILEKGDKAKLGDHRMITEAMKMEITVQAPFDGTIKSMYIQNGDSINTGDLLVEVVNQTRIPPFCLRWGK